MARLLFPNFWKAVVPARLRCADERACGIEANLPDSMGSRKLFDDDTPIAPKPDITRTVRISPFGLTPKIT